MPTYEYRCESCGHELELYQGITEAPKKKCPACKKQRLKRKIGGGAGFLFKGSGFYLTDYRSASYKKGADAEAKPAGEAAAEKKPASPAPEKGSEKGSEKSAEKSPSEKPKEKKKSK
jgi:putative FmdB family regulatory protein